MDYEPTNQNQYQSAGSSGSIWKWIVIIVILIAAGLAWYIYFYKPAAAPAPESSLGELTGTISEGDTTADILNDLNQTPSDSAAAQEIDSLNQNIQNF